MVYNSMRLLWGKRMISASLGQWQIAILTVKWTSNVARYAMGVNNLKSATIGKNDCFTLTI